MKRPLYNQVYNYSSSEWQWKSLAQIYYQCGASQPRKVYSCYWPCRAHSSITDFTFYKPKIFHCRKNPRNTAPAVDKHLHLRRLVLQHFKTRQDKITHTRGMVYCCQSVIQTHTSNDIIQLFLKTDPEKPVAVMFSFASQKTYSALVVGLDYDLLYEHNIYKQILYQTVMRAKSLESEKLDLAYTAEIQKKKVGAKVNPTYSFVRSMEHLNAVILSTMS